MWWKHEKSQSLPLPTPPESQSVGNMVRYLRYTFGDFPEPAHPTKLKKKQFQNGRRRKTITSRSNLSVQSAKGPIQERKTRSREQTQRPKTSSLSFRPKVLHSKPERPHSHSSRSRVKSFAQVNQDIQSNCPCISEIEQSPRNEYNSKMINDEESESEACLQDSFTDNPALIEHVEHCIDLEAETHISKVESDFCGGSDNEKCVSQVIETNSNKSLEGGDMESLNASEKKKDSQKFEQKDFIELNRIRLREISEKLSSFLATPTKEEQQQKWQIEYHRKIGLDRVSSRFVWNSCIPSFMLFYYDNIYI